MPFRALLIGLLLPLSLFAQTQPAPKKPITLEDAFVRGTFTQASTAAMAFTADDRHVTDLKDNHLIKRSVERPEAVDTLIRARELAGKKADGYVLSDDERRVLLHTQTTPIYRHSFTAVCYVFDLATRSLLPVFDGKPVQNAALSPDGARIAFVYRNNLYTQELAPGGATVQVTTSGEKNKLIHGATDWVYEEEFSFAEGFQWSPDGARLAYYTFDESAVPVFGMDMYGGLYPERVEFKYPKAGEKNSVVTLHVYEISSGKHTRVDVGPVTDQYIPRLRWTADPFKLAFLRLNRLQNHLELLVADALTGQSRVVISERSDTYLEVTDHSLYFLPGGTEVLWHSDRSGWLQFYRYELSGKLLGAVTSGAADATSLLAVDAKSKTLYYTAAEPDPREQHVFAVGLNGKGKRRLTEVGLYHTATFSPKGSYWLDRASAPALPTTTTLKKADGAVVRVLEDNAKLKAKLGEYDRAEIEFLSFTNAAGVTLYGYLLRPANFDSTQKRPLLMFTYGGPSGPQVSRNFGSTANAWFHHLVGQGYLVACFDNRGSDGRGRDFRKTHYKRLGVVEVEDQLAAARYMAAKPYVDPSRIGIYGHSYGGYMALLCMAKGNTVFKAGISGAPVTSWRYYDTIYTERYMSLPDSNQAGYDATAPLKLAADIRGPILLMHGAADDNVHFQNSMDFVEAMVQAGKPLDMAFYPNRNHGIGGRGVTLHRYRLMTDWLKRNL